MLKGVLPLLLLQLLDEREDYGYSVVVRLHEAGFPDLAEGTVYPALSRLEAGGALGARLVRSSAGPARKYYALTPVGHVELARGLDAWLALLSSVSRVLPTPDPTRSTP